MFFLEDISCFGEEKRSIENIQYVETLGVLLGVVCRQSGVFCLLSVSFQELLLLRSLKSTSKESKKI